MQSAPARRAEAIPSSIDAGTAHVADIASMSRLLKASMYWRTVPIGSVVSAGAVDAAVHIEAIMRSAWRAVGITITVAPQQQ
jgi:hypothetical protein